LPNIATELKADNGSISATVPDANEHYEALCDLYIIVRSF